MLFLLSIGKTNLWLRSAATVSATHSVVAVALIQRRTSWFYRACLLYAAALAARAALTFGKASVILDGAQYRFFDNTHKSVSIA
ncbi:hypothetical protein [Vreelandella sulfidaeris]|uniref:hypothetical protein n=1 Tax=Vreelandella sulfidaeris TaxID=115553 RepID=UPI0035E94B38